MPVYRVVRKSDRKTVYAYSADAVVEFHEYPLADFDHILEVAVVDNAIQADTGTRVTRLAFRNRFTMQEKAAIEIAALDNPAADMQARGLAATLRAYMDDIQAAAFVDLARADTRGGVQQLEALGILAAGRALEILDAPITDEERYTG